MDRRSCLEVLSTLLGSLRPFGGFPPNKNDGELPQRVLSVAVPLKVLAIALAYRDLLLEPCDALPHISYADFAFA